MANIFLTALSVSPQKNADLAVPRVVSLDTANILKAILLNESGVEHVLLKEKKAERYVRNIKVAENLGQYLMHTDFNNAASSPYNTAASIKQNLAACGSGTAQAASAIPVTGGNYFISVTAATATTMVGVKLPNASSTGRLKTALVIRNAATADITVIPAASEKLDSGTAGTKVIKAGQFAHFYCSATDKWVTARGPYF